MGVMFKQPGPEFDAFVLQASPALLRLAFRLTGDRQLAEDVLQTALVRVARNWGRAVDNPWAYTNKALVSASTDGWRRQQRRVVELAASQPDGTSAPDALRSIEDREQLLQALRALPKQMRAVLVLRYWEDLSIEETSRLLGCSQGTVKSTTNRGLERLRGVITSKEYVE
ncbi:MAG: hypothetical protein JWM40_1026 [Frankiales bacterium]|nr:hypothetical protein [Frankiales bacterium]